MEVKIDNCLFDSEKSFIGLIFKDDAERIHVANLLLDMESKEGKRALLVFPADKDCSEFIEQTKQML